MLSIFREQILSLGSILISEIRFQVLKLLTLSPMQWRQSQHVQEINSDVMTASVSLMKLYVTRILIAQMNQMRDIAVSFNFINNICRPINSIAGCVLVIFWNSVFKKKRKDLVFYILLSIYFSTFNSLVHMQKIMINLQNDLFIITQYY